MNYKFQALAQVSGLVPSHNRSFLPSTLTTKNHKFIPIKLRKIKNQRINKSIMNYKKNNSQFSIASLRKAKHYLIINTNE